MKMWMRLNGKVVFSNDMVTKKAIVESSELVKSIYQIPDNPIFEIFFFEDAKAIIADFSDNPPKEYLL